MVNKKITFYGTRKNKGTEKVFVVPKGEEREVNYFFSEKKGNLFVKIVLKENSNLKLKLHQKSTEKMQIFKEIILGKNSVLELEDNMTDGIIINKTEIIMKENSNLKLINFHIAKQEHQGRINLVVKEPNCVAKIETRNLVKNGKTKVSGLIFVSENGENFSGNYIAKNIIIGTGKAESTPELDIRNSEVYCGHSSTTETISEEQLFYLMTRGLDEKSAERNILEGLFGEENLKIIYEENE